MPMEGLHRAQSRAQINRFITLDEELIDQRLCAAVGLFYRAPLATSAAAVLCSVAALARSVFELRRLARSGDCHGICVIPARW